LKLIAVSIGNSRITAALVDGEKVLSKNSVGVISTEEWTALIAWMNQQDSNHKKVCVSVNPTQFKLFEDALKEQFILIGRDIPIPIENLTSPSGQTGHDRLMNGYAASKIYGSPTIVVDFGTAFTFNLIDSKGSFLGGAIAPGLDLASASLSNCAQLPEVKPELDLTPLVGHDTESAIMSGLLNGYLGMVETMIMRFLDQTNNSAAVVATGGYAPYFTSHLSVFSSHDPDLLFKGIALAYAAS